MKAMIFAAGLGTRLKPFTDSAPKALFPVCGTTLLELASRKVSECRQVDEIVVNVHHFADQIMSEVASERFRQAFPGISFRISDESSELLETGGGILCARPLLEGSGDFIMHNADIVSNADIQTLVSAHNGSLATLLVSRRKASRYLLFDDGLQLRGWWRPSDNAVRSPFPDTDPEKCLKLAFSGIHIASQDIFKVMEDMGFSGKFSITDFYLAACAHYPVRAHIQEDLVLADAGKPENIPMAEDIVRSCRTE